MTTAWTLPTIAAEATGFSVLRLLSGYHAQGYEPVYAPGGHSSVVKVLTTARRLKTVEPLSFLTSTPYAVVQLVAEDGTLLEQSLAIRTHQAFLWWAANMGLTPNEPIWAEVNPEDGEDPAVPLLLTTDTARLLTGILSDHQLFSDAPITGDSRMVVFQVLDTLRRLIGYADNDREHRPEPEEDNTSVLAFLLDKHEQET